MREIFCDSDYGRRSSTRRRPYQYNLPEWAGIERRGFHVPIEGSFGDKPITRRREWHTPKLYEHEANMVSDNGDIGWPRARAAAVTLAECWMIPARYSKCLPENGTQPAFVEPQFEPVSLREPFDLGFPIF